jgi:flagellar biosynthesis protein FlhF
MQVKKFEAPTIQEALETIKRELGPEAIILQTKKNKRGFGLLSKDSVEVTAAVSERSLQKKEFAEKRLPPTTKEAVNKMPADRQAEFLNKYSEKSAPKQAQKQAPKHATSSYSNNARGVGAELAGAPIDALMRSSGRSQDRVEVSARPSAQSQAQARAQAQAQLLQQQARHSAQAAATKGAQQASSRQASGQQISGKRLTATRYIDIDGHEVEERIANTAPKMTMEEEVRLLKRMIEELKTSQDNQIPSGSGAQALLNPAAAQSANGSLATAALQDAYEQLVLNGIDKRYAWNLLKQVAFELGDDRANNPDDVLDQVAAEIMQSTEIGAPLSEAIARAESAENRVAGGPVILALVGPTGVGKTTTVAKMASEALLRRNLKVGLINLDSYKVAAFDQLGTYAKILNVPFRSCGTADELRAAIQDFQSLDLVIVDTTGRSQRDPEQLREMQELLGQVPQLRTQLVLSVTTRDAELYDMANRFSMFRPQGIIVSKLDEATIYGSIYNVSQKVKLPLLYFTTGQRVPEDIEEASPERVAALILDL